MVIFKNIKIKKKNKKMQTMWFACVYKYSANNLHMIYSILYLFSVNWEINSGSNIAQVLLSLSI